MDNLWTRLWNDWPTVVAIAVRVAIVAGIVAADVDPDAVTAEVVAAIAALLDLGRWLHVRAVIPGPVTHRRDIR